MSIVDLSNAGHWLPYWLQGPTRLALTWLIHSEMKMQFKPGCVYPRVYPFITMLNPNTMLNSSLWIELQVCFKIQFLMKQFFTPFLALEMLVWWVFCQMQHFWNTGPPNGVPWYQLNKQDVKLGTVNTGTCGWFLETFTGCWTTPESQTQRKGWSGADWFPALCTTPAAQGHEKTQQQTAKKKIKKWQRKKTFSISLCGKFKRLFWN